MFRKKEKNIKTNQEVDDKISQDFITHNMPDPRLFSGQTFINGEKKNDRAIKNSGPENHHKVGLLIIIGGFLLIIAIFYFGYSYFIKPMVSKSEKNVSPNNEVVEVTNEKATETAEIILPVEIINTDTPVIETSTIEITTTTEPIFTEETPIVSSTINVSTVDSDADGLTDNEEKIVGTDPNKADSDNDGYLDLAELKSGYDPLTPSAKITKNTNVLLYKIDDKVTTIYPASWEISRNDGLEVIIFSNPDKAFIQVTSQDNPDKVQPSTWFSQQFPDSLPGESISVGTWQGFYTQDGLAAYIFNQDFSKVYSFSCSPLTEDTSSIVTFNLMIKSLTFK